MDALAELLIWLIRAAYKAYRRRLLGDGEEDEAELQITARAAPPDDPGTIRRRIEAELGDVRSEIDAFARTESDDPVVRSLQDFAARSLLDGVDARLDASRTSSDPAAAAPHFAAEAAAARRASRTLQRMVDQRLEPRQASLLRDVEVVANALYQPLLEFRRKRSIPLSSRTVVAVEGETPGDLTRLFARSPLAPIEVSARLHHDVLGWPTIALEVGRDLLASLHGMGDEVRAAAGFPRARPRLDPGYLSEAHVQGALGTWLPELCADGLASMLAGPAYLASLVALRRQPDRPYRTRTVQVADAHVLPIPPAELRVRTATAVLQQLGFADEATELLDDWVDDHGDLLEFLFPVGGGRYAAIPEDMWLQPVRDLARALCAHQSPLLEGLHLVDVPDLHYSLARHREAEAVAASAGGSHVEDPRAAMAGYALKAYREPELRMQLLPLLRASCGHLVPQRADRPSQREPSTGESLLSPGVLRDAVVLQDVFRRRRAW